MSCPEHIVQLMHKYLDGDILPEDESQLKEHLNHAKTAKSTFMKWKNPSLLSRARHILQLRRTLQPMCWRICRRKSERHRSTGGLKLIRFSGGSFVYHFDGRQLFSSWKNDQDFSVSSQPNLVVKTTRSSYLKAKLSKAM